MELFGSWTVRHNLILLLTAAFIAGCSGTPSVLPTTEPEVVVEEVEPEQSQIEPEVKTYGLDSDDDIVVVDDPRELMAQAETANINEAPALLIRATRLFIGQGQAASAQIALSRLDNYSLTPDERFSQQVLVAQLASLNGDHEKAIAMLNIINVDQIVDIEQKAGILVALGRSQAALGRHSNAVSSLLQLDALIQGNERVKNQRNMLALFSVMDPLHISILREQTQNPNLDGWLALSEILESSPEEYRELDLANWKRLYPGHPAMPELLGEESIPIDLAEYNQIALMLPLTSAYGNAAQAFYDGFMDAHNASNAFRLPQVLLYDIGAESFLSSFYYRAAISDGADFVVGPLGRKAVEALLSDNTTPVNTFVIADIPEGQYADNLFAISLSPEQEARQSAEKAFESGFRAVSILRSETEWGQRVADAFAVHWESMGGEITKNSFVPKDVPDYTRVLQKFLGLNESIARHRLLEAQVGSKLKFTPRRNDDMDFLFLAANADHARLVVPQLRFFQAHNLPIYATSYVYTGQPNPATDADLDGLIFGDMEWVLSGVQNYKQKIAEEEARKAEEEAAKLLEQQQALIEGEGEFEDSEGVGDIDEQEVEATTESDEIPGDDELPEDDLLAIDDELIGDDVLEDQSSRGDYESSTLGRLYALGFETYNIIPRAESMRGNSLQEYTGENMTVSIADDGSVIRHPVWVTFNSGLVEPTLVIPSIDTTLQE